jgi:trehalose-6-phosphate synthase
LAVDCIDLDNNGYFVNDFQLSQVPATLKNLDPNKPVTFFLHTPWPKVIPRNNSAIKILEFMATGMLGADVITFQTQRDLQAFEGFVSDYLPTQTMNMKQYRLTPWTCLSSQRVLRVSIVLGRTK